MNEYLISITKNLNLKPLTCNATTDIDWLYIRKFCKIHSKTLAPESPFKKDSGTGVFLWILQNF